ncbi:hypothetical protein [Luteolibacter luteus]|uniref:Uncharacterized protein n=1 Tax=Luteolibacter luteus TaxID=2728835 RepID=A0A858RK84_9BACT|nr:hypothetical protein [Luteolibacter luteus]QJE96868.1 hypothetical protein HHL09_14095 [Luteolibacter luteus]
MFRILLLILVPFLGIANALTVGWKVPIEQFNPDLTTNGRVRKLDRPPGESAFFKAGDELWEISKAVEWRGEPRTNQDPFEESDAIWQGDWIVWNASSRMIVARGTFVELKEAEKSLGFEEGLSVMKMRFELSGGAAGGDERRVLSLSSSNGKKAKAESHGFQVSAEPYAGQSASTDLIWSASWPAGEEDSSWKAEATVVLKDGQEFLLARGGEGQGAWKLTGSVVRQTIDGIRSSESRWVELPKQQVMPWPPGHEEFAPVRRPLGESLQIGVYSGAADFLYQEDPVLVEPPAALAEWVTGPVIDARESLEILGFLFLREGFFAGFDVKSGRLLTIADAQQQEMLQDDFVDSPRAPFRLWAETNLEAGGITCRSGQKASLFRSRKGEIQQLFEIEATEGDDRIVDVRYAIQIAPDEKATGGMSLIKEKPQALAKFLRSGKETDFTLTIRDHWGR